ncbi:hypothetical protein niasHT_031348 [Heterodera trifolii]|uniref:F-box domain-containing protein n=1 Tax=Heterodera trifolii TaxID=157864 RepID=A0ABD2IWS8_9BILA
MADNGNEAEEEMAQAPFISADCWLKVFELLPPSQLGLGIALISRRFDSYVDEHFKTRKWALKIIHIERTIGENGTKEMRIDSFDLAENEGMQWPIPQIQLPSKVIGFRSIDIFFIDRNAIAFLRRFRQLFAASPIHLMIYSTDECISELILHNIWPMLRKNICGMFLSDKIFRRFRHFAPSILNDNPSIRIFSSYFDEIFTEFPADDNAMASDGQSVAKWLFTPRPDGVPKVLKCYLDKNDENLATKIEAIKTAFASASASVNFIVVISFLLSSFAASVVPFELTNEKTGEQLALKRANNSDHFLLIRCPIAREASKWAKWEKEAIGWEIHDQWNRISIQVYHKEEIGDGLLDEIPGPSDQQK